MSRELAGPLSPEQAEREHIVAVLKTTRGNKYKAAKLLKMSRGTLYRRLRAYGLDRLVRNPLDGLEP